MGSHASPACVTSDDVLLPQALLATELFFPAINHDILMEFSTFTVYSSKDSHFASKLCNFQKLETMKRGKGCWMIYYTYDTSILETGIGEYLFRAISEVHSEELEGGREKEEGATMRYRGKDSLNI